VPILHKLKLDIDPLFFEETELDRGGSHEIRRRIHVSNHQPKTSTDASKTRVGKIAITVIEGFSWPSRRSSDKARRLTGFRHPARTGSFQQRSPVKSWCRNREGRA